MDENRAAHLIVRGVSKRFGATTVLDRIDLTIRRGELVTLLGPSGCGKTTLLRAIAGLAQPDRGQVELAGRDITLVPPHRRNVGVVFQSYALFPHLTVAGNVAFGLKVRGRGRAEIDAAVERALALVKLEHLAKRRISALSGGQQQRVALARAIAVEPDVLLFDEALSALDRKLREEMQVELRRLLQNVGVTAIFVTHDQDEALTMSDRIVIMREGQIEQVGRPEEVYQRPTSRFTASFLGAANFFRGRVTGNAAGVVTVAIPDGPLLSIRTSREVGSEVTVALRPETVAVGPCEAETGVGAPNMTPALVEQVIYHGFITHLHMRLPSGDPLLAFLRQGAGLDGVPLSPGMRVIASWPQDAAQIVRDEID
jgi:putative spermidine/putrescine transport system ATP-binding protein